MQKIIEKQEVPPEIEGLGDYFVAIYLKCSDLVSRRQVQDITDLYSRRTLANLDSEGQGPAESLLIGRTIYYPRAVLVLWLASKVKSRNRRKA